MRFLLLLLLLVPSIGNSQSTFFQSFWSENTISQQHINCQLKDSDGFFWIGTQDGLNRFDAYRFHSFWNDSADSLSLSNHFIWCLKEDHQKNIWVGTYGGGLNLYNAQSETFQAFYPGGSSKDPVAEHSIRSIVEFPKGKLLIGTDRGYWEFDLSQKKFSPQDTILNQGLTSVTALHPIDERWLLLGSTEGLFLVDRQNNTKSLIPTSQAFTLITDFLEVKEEIWVAGSPGILKLKYLDSINPIQVLDHLTPLPIQNENRLNNACTSLLIDDYQKLWVGSLGGVYQIDPNQPPTNWKQLEGLPDQQINSILQLEPGLLSIGTREGLRQAKTPPPLFEILNSEKVPELCSSVILGLDQDKTGQWWIGTREGLFTCDSSWQNGACITPDNTLNMPVPYIINSKVLDGEVWVTFWRGGLGKITKQEGGWKVDTIPGLYQYVRGAGMHDIIKGPKGNYWIATPNQGVIKWTPATNTIHPFTPVEGDSSALSSPYVFHLLMDQKDQLWISTANGGLGRMNLETEKIITYSNQTDDPGSLSNNLVLSTFEDSKGRIWACTAAGLNLFLPDGHFQRFTKKDGLPNETVYGMLEDNLGYLWISTNGGLCKMREVEDEWTFQIFTAEDGLQSNEFNQYSFLALNNGKLCFGGSQGLNCFRPERIQPSSYIPNIAITDFLLFNESQRAGGILTKMVNLEDKIILAHHQNFLAFEFAALGYQQAQNQQYAYRMVGLEEEWVYAENRRFASYPNLAPGHYTFEVKAANHDGVWGESNKNIDIYIKAPWWVRWWAWLIWIGLITFAVWQFIKFRENSVRNIEQAKSQEREAFRKRTAQDFHDEAGNRITKLSLLTEVAKRQALADSTILDQLEENTQALRASMRDFIWVLDPTKDQLIDMYQRLVSAGNQLFEHSSTRFQASPYPSATRPISLPGQHRRHLLMIFQEAMNNAVKYASAENTQLGIQIEASKATIYFQDNGQGIEGDQNKGYGIQNMHDRAQKIGGTLLISSGAEIGTRVTLEWEITHLGD